MDQEVNVIPDFVILIDMHLKSFLCVTIQCLSTQSTDVTPVLHIIFLHARFLSQLSESVNNNTKDHIE